MKWELPLFLLAASIHEIGHCLALFIFHVPISSFRLSLAGARLDADLGLISYKKEIFIYLAGPLFNLIGAAISFVLVRKFFSLPLLYFFFCNALLSFLNLFPVRGLDGYESLFSALCQRSDPARADTILSPISHFFSFLLFFLGAVTLIRFHNASLLLLIFILTLEEKRKKATRNS